MEERCKTMSDDLKCAHENASIAKRELSAKIAQLEDELSHKNESLRILEDEVKGSFFSKPLDNQFYFFFSEKSR